MSQEINISRLAEISQQEGLLPNNAILRVPVPASPEGLTQAVRKEIALQALLTAFERKGAGLDKTEVISIVREAHEKIALTLRPKKREELTSIVDGDFLLIGEELGWKELWPLMAVEQQRDYLKKRMTLDKERQGDIILTENDGSLEGLFNDELHLEMTQTKSLIEQALNILQRGKDSLMKLGDEGVPEFTVRNLDEFQWICHEISEECLIMVEMLRQKEKAEPLNQAEARLIVLLEEKRQQIHFKLNHSRIVTANAMQALGDEVQSLDELFETDKSFLEDLKRAAKAINSRYDTPERRQQAIRIMLFEAAFKSRERAYKGNVLGIEKRINEAGLKVLRQRMAIAYLLRYAKIAKQQSADPKEILEVEQKALGESTEEQ